jgi:tetratricopeptide (TPR) repeat protein
MPLSLTPLHKAMRLTLPVLLVIPLSACGSPEERAQSYYKDGMQLLAKHDNAQAMVEFKNAVGIKKDYVDAWLALAKVEELNRNFAGEIPYLRQVAELKPNDIKTKLRLANLLLLAGATDDALNFANAAYDLDHNNADALAIRAVILLRLKQMPKAVVDADAALKIDPKNAGAMVVLAADRVQSGDTDAALQILDKAETDTGGKDVGVELYKLKLFEQTKNWAQAEALLKKLVGRYPDRGFRTQLVRLYVFEKRPDDAEKELHAIIASKPGDPKPELALVRLLSIFKGPAAARQELEARITADEGKDVFPYRLALAQLNVAQGEVKAGEQQLKALISDASAKDTLAAQVVLAQFYFNQKNLDAADKLVSQILQKDSRNPDGLKLRAAILIKRGHVEEAIEDLREALNDQPQSTDLMMLLATAYEANGSIDLADREFAEALRESSLNPVVGLSYVAFLRRRGNVSRAEDVLTDLTSRWPQNKEVLANLAEIKLERRDWSDAQAIAERIKNLGDSAQADEILGTALLAQDKYSQGISALQDAHAAAPTAPQPLASLVQAYMRAKRTDKAVALLQQTLKSDPSNAEAYVLFGAVQQATNQPDQALNSFKMAIEKQPGSFLGYQALAQFYLSQHKIDQGQDVLRAGLKEQPDNAVLRLMLAGILERKQDYNDAINEYESMLARDPGSLIVVNNLASLLADYRTDKDSLKRAQSLAERLRQSPVPQFKDTVGWIDYRTGKYEDAVPLLEQAATQLSNRADVHYHLGMAYIASGEPAKASAQLDLALKEGPTVDLKKKIQNALKGMTGKG